MKTSKTASKEISGAKRGNTPVTPENANLTPSRKLQRRLYIITTGEYDGYRIIALVAGPKTPALSTMQKRFEALYHKPKWTQNMERDGYAFAKYTYAKMDYEQNLRGMGYAGNCVAEWFIDWLLKTDARFERVDYQETNL